MMKMERRFQIEVDGLPDLPGMMLVTVEALRDLGGSATIQELDERVIELEGVSEEEQSFSMPRDENRPRVNYYLAWARTYLKRGGALENSARAVWALTEAGSTISSIEETRAIYELVTLEERARAKAKRSAAKLAGVEAVETPESEPDNAEDWKSQLLAVLVSMAPDAFERLSQRLLREAGFTKVEVRGKSGDGGIDGLGVLRVNLVSFQVYFQCKRWKGSVGSKEIRDFRGALQGRADKGLFITTGHFTSQASDEATRDGAIAIDLIDGDRLCDLLKENRLGVETAMIERVKIDPDWFGGI
ncbi:Restriction endonuclease [uncultured Sphingopyxis sp.]|jgi:restriction system protein|uniref:Restriction endonuclease n=1 Tax=uncultured Sphingopyxis sp. TaxID=310581 RepID=A0A1Y5Q2H0_9SPHN|nr:restriction endonuclease [uncultured Sphingopyxis sp.]SBV35005.1 Restriction endonuclease [uncultured Sphingopyxis sp.]